MSRLSSSTDLSHFYEAERADQLDTVFCQRFLELDPHGLHEALSRGDCEACGGAPAVSALVALSEHQASATCLMRTHSGHIGGDMSSVVGYAALAVEVGDE